MSTGRYLSRHEKCAKTSYKNIGGRFRNRLEVYINLGLSQLPTKQKTTFLFMVALKKITVKQT